MRFKIETATMSDPRVAAYLAEATDTSNRFRSKIHLDEALGAGKKFLRVHRARDGRFFVMVGLRGHSRSYLADRCEITSFEGCENPIFKFRLDIIERSYQADRAAFAARYPECA